MTDKPVVVYGASGYTGRLICEYLREYHVPFVAAGRDADKLKASMEQQRRRHRDRRLRGRRGQPRRRVADRAVLRAPRWSATRSARSASYGPEVVEACLAAGAHYIDTTGEQDWLITCDEKYGADFAAAGLLLSPGIAQMYTTGEIAAELCLETPGLDTLDIAVFWGGSPTIASTQTILFNAALSGAHYLEQNTYVALRPRGRALPAGHPGPARARPSHCRGAAPRTRSGTAATRASPTSRRSAGSSTGR